QEEADKLGVGSEFLEGQWQVARERFNLALQERTLLRDQIGVVRQQLDRRKQALKRLTRSEPDPASEANRSTQGADKIGKDANDAGSGKKSGDPSPAADAGAAKTAEAGAGGAG